MAKHCSNSAAGRRCSLARLARRCRIDAASGAWTFDAPVPLPPGLQAPSAFGLVARNPRFSLTPPPSLDVAIMTHVRSLVLPMLASLAISPCVLAQSTQKLGSATVTTTVQSNGDQDIKVTTGADSAQMDHSNGTGVKDPPHGNSGTVTLKPGETVKISVGGGHFLTITNTP